MYVDYMGASIVHTYILQVSIQVILILYIGYQRCDEKNVVMSNIYKKVIAHRGARTHDHKVKSLALYRLS